MANFAPSPSAETRAADGPPRPRETIGTLLRRAREEQGVDLERIAAQLRIREAYLAAIEQARYDRLPGPVYALGFVRTYANHLGLDGEEAVRRFKLEAAGMEQRRDLAFPMPLTQRSIPGGRMVLIACILALCAYGIWHYVSTDRNRPERVAAVPTDLLPPPQPAPASPQPAAVPSTSAAPSTPAPPNPAASAPPPSTPASSPAAGPSDQTVAAMAPPTTEPDTPVTASPVAPPAAGSLAAPPPPPLPGTGVVDNNPPPSAPPAQAAQPAPPETAASPEQVASTAPSGTPDAAANAAAPAPPAAPRVFGAVDGPSRITLKAVKDCWILVRDSDAEDAVVAQRTLHAGDSYRVPDRAGLVLRTGNASGLEVDVDDKTAPALGGTVRNVALDPVRLLAGDAAAE